MSSREEPGFRPVRRYRTSKDQPDSVTCYLDIVGRVSLARVLDELGNVAGGIASDDLTLGGGIIMWRAKASADELARWSERDAAAQARTEAWERETYARLHAKFAGGGS